MAAPQRSMKAFRQKSLYLSETAFHDAAVHAVDSCAAAERKDDDPNALHDTEKMVKVARAFLRSACPALLTSLEEHHDSKSSTDRLVKVGRNVSSTVSRRRSSLASLASSPSLGDLERASKEENENGASQQKRPAEEGAGGPDPSPLLCKTKTDEILGLLASECADLASVLSDDGAGDGRRVSKVRFGKTELQMPVLTLGCMRFQQSWNRGGPSVLSMEQVSEECQTNLVEIIRYAVKMGVNHIETAKAYGCSEMQIGEALRVLFESGEIRREDLIIQTKGGVSSSQTPADYKRQILNSLELLQLDYVDLFSVHGVNTDDDYNYLFNHGDKGNLITALHELKAEGKVCHVGFSTHGRSELIGRLIRTEEFEYVNLHYHFCGSYTASGDSSDGRGNLENIRLCQERDMGVFIISPYDKGGRLYAPSTRLRELTLPEMEPMTYGCLWLWQHRLHDPMNTPVHTIVCGAARPSDLDQPILASFLLRDEEEASMKRQKVATRLEAAMERALGDDWVKNWHVGLPNESDARYGTQLANMVWMHNIIKSFGMLDFAKDRYAPLQDHASKWDRRLSPEENKKKIGPSFSWMPGCAYNASIDYSADLANCPEENREKLMDAIKFTHRWCAKAGAGSKEDGEEKNSSPPDAPPPEWTTSYDMRPWTAFPERA